MVERAGDLERIVPDLARGEVEAAGVEGRRETQRVVDVVFGREPVERCVIVREVAGSRVVDLLDRRRRAARFGGVEVVAGVAGTRHHLPRRP